MHSTSFPSLIVAAAATASLASGVVHASSSSSGLFMHPPPRDTSRSFQLTPPQLNAVLSHHLEISKHEEMPSSQSSMEWMNALELNQGNDLEGVVGNTGPRTLLVVAYDEEDSQAYLPNSISPHFVPLTSTPPPSSFDALVSTHLSWVASDFSPATRVEGFSSFAEQVEKAIGMEVEWPHAVKTASDHVTTLPIDEAKGHYSGPLLDIFAFSDESAAPLLSELHQLEKAFDSLQTDDASSRVLALRLSGLANLRTRYGKDSEQYLIAREALQKMIEATYSAFSSPSPDSSKFFLLSVSPSSSSNQKRSADTSLLSPFRSSRSPAGLTIRNNKAKRSNVSPRAPSENRPIVPSYRTCYSDYYSCADATVDCNGRGTCIQGASTILNECWVCSCGSTVTGEGNKAYTQTWTGEFCEKEDISSDFNLLVWSSAGLLLVLAFSVALLYKVGSVELPSQLASVGGGHGKAD